MFRHQITGPTWIIMGCAFAATILFVTRTTTAQHAQREAAAQVARENVAAEKTAKASPVSNDASRKDDGTPSADPERLKRRAGERVGEGPRGRSLVLGMHLQEAGRGGVKVIEVAAASPAFDAGIHERDELVSFAGFHANTYRKWIDGISRLVTEAPDNSRLPVVVMRGGERVEIQIRVPEGHVADAVKLPLGPLAQQAPAPDPVGLPVPVGPAAGGANNIAIDNAGPFGSFFTGESNPASERAMAEIFHIGKLPQVAARGNQRPPIVGPTPDKGARIGLAGFRDDPNGMIVMVDVGALEPGNYLVGISDPA